MGIKELITEFKETENAQKKQKEKEEYAEQVRLYEEQKVRETILKERYEKERDPMILQHRRLFQELQQIGLISMINEMTKYEIETRMTEPERKLYMEELNKDPKKKAAHIDRIRNTDSTEGWKGEMEWPKQLEDGSLDPTLKLTIFYLGFPGLVYGATSRYVDISYSPATISSRLLVISGQEKTFNSAIEVSEGGYDVSEIELALAKAFYKPREEHVPSHNQRFPKPRGRF